MIHPSGRSSEWAAAATSKSTLPAPMRYRGEPASSRSNRDREASEMASSRSSSE
jgi:hypothetical protein